ncbi:patched domain-containing protein 3-like [Centruroides vittatus]|uniref:patched domain-containing protein 3-like n=1 Tax=Centruroides vittatus TaxID=120091 RepID=UPI00350FE6B5
MTRISVGVILKEKFRDLGYIIGRHPLPFLIIPIVFTAISAIGILRFSYVQDADYLYNPQNSKAFYERQTIEKTFPLNKSSNFEPGRLTRLGKLGWLLIYPKDGGSALRESILDTLYTIDNIVNNISIEWKGEKLFYKDLCAKNNGKCYENVIFSLKKWIKDIERNRSFVKYPILLNEETYSFKFFAANLGGVTVDDLGYVTFAKFVRLMYFLNDQGEENLEKTYKWETVFLDEMKNMKFSNVDVFYFVSSSLEREIHNMITDIIPYYVLLLFVMLTFCFISTLTKDWVRSKPWLGVASVLSVGMAIFTSVGVVFACGVPFIDILVAVPFLLLGIGLDDTFVMLAAWKKTNPNANVDERISQTLSETAVSITITSLTNFISFMFGFMTPFPAVKIFCSFAATGIFFTYLYQISFFSAAAAIFGILEKKRFHSLFFVPMKPSKKKSVIHTLLCCTSESTDYQDDKIMAFFRDTLSYYFSYKWFKISITFSYIVYLSFAIWGCFHLKEGTELHFFTPFNSYAATFLNHFFEDYREYRDRIQVIIPTTLNYADPKVRDEIEDMIRKLEDTPYIANKELTESWLRYFKTFQNDPRASIYLRKYNFSAKSDYLHALRNTFLNYPPAVRFRNDIIFNENFTEITASRFLIQTKVTGDFNEAKFMLVRLREIVNNASFPVFLSQFFFPFYDQFLTIGTISQQTLLTCGCTMLFLIILFIPDIRCFIAAVLNMISIETGVIGYMSFWGVNLDTVTMMVLIMCVGFSVDYVAHMATSYLESDEKTDMGRLKRALHSVGTPIVQGSVTTILGVIVILACPSYIFLCFVKIVFLLITIAAFHSILLLPLLFVFLDNVLPKYLLTVGRSKIVSSVRETTTERQESMKFLDGTMHL